MSLAAVALLVTAAGCGGEPAGTAELGADDTIESSEALSLVTPVARTLNIAVELAVDATSVYWVEIPSPGTGDDKSRLMKRSKSAFALGGPQQLAAQQGTIYDLLEDTNHLYWRNQEFVDGELKSSAHRVSKFGGVVETLSNFPEDPHAWAIDGAYLYAATSEGIERISKTTGAREVIVTAEWPTYLNLIVDTTHLYWVNYDGIFSAPKTGGAATLLVEDRIYGFVLSGSYIYYTTYGVEELRRVSTTGEGAATVLKNFWPGSQWGGRTVDVPFVVSGNNVIWLDSHQSHPWDYGRVQKTSLVTGLTQTIALAQPGLSDLAVDATHAYWTRLGTFTNEWPPRHNRDGAVLKAFR